ncbi:MAG TPA: prolyl oligopeptidase family serine peptidase [Streptosporangiaceae bacterium]|nr:prolyl oligopeptidase family serine peptidase [Streptosporangiaceae bacterium]
MRHFRDDDFQFGLELALGAAYHQAADIGEVLATADRIKDGDSDAWVTEWLGTAGICRTAGEQAQNAGRKVSAVSAYRRAATYYATAIAQIPRAASGQAARELEIWRLQRQCWDRVVDLQSVAGERVTISYENTTLPGYFFRARDAAPGEPRPLVVMNNGSDGATSQMWVEGGAAAADRGYHWMTFDGPGQQASLYEQELFFRPDWEAVLTPVLDSMLARPDVDPGRVAVIGVSQGGYWVPRALAFEHRFAAAVADPGVTDVSASWTRSLPEMMRKQLREGDRAAFDRELHLAELLSPGIAATLAYRGHPYGVASDSRHELYETVAAYRLAGQEQQITTPLLITDPEAEQFWPGQSRELFSRLPGPKHLVTFTAHEGASRHCEPMARSLRESRVFDWLEECLR